MSKFLSLLSASALFALGASGQSGCYHMNNNACPGGSTYDGEFAGLYYQTQIFSEYDISITDLDAVTHACVLACQTEYLDDLTSCELLDDREENGYLNVCQICVEASDEGLTSCIRKCIIPAISSGRGLGH